MTSVTNHRKYNSFGKLVSESNTAADLIFGFTGKQLDEATGLQHNLFRWYDSDLGRWLSEAPIGFVAGDENLYRYVGNHATYANDPSGLQEPIKPISPRDPYSPYIKNFLGEWVENSSYIGLVRPSLINWVQEQENSPRSSRPYSESGDSEIGPESQWHFNRRMQEKAEQEYIERQQMIHELQEATITLLSAGRGGASLPPRRGVPLPKAPRTPISPFPWKPPVPSAPSKTSQIQQYSQQQQGNGSYINQHQSGKDYIGKGGPERMEISAAQKAIECNDPVVSKTHTPAPDTKRSFIDEQNAIETAGGPGGNTYNKINSPGKKLK